MTLKRSQTISNKFIWFVKRTKTYKLLEKPTNSYQASRSHQVPKTWVKQHPKTAKATKTNENQSPSSSMHKLVSNLVPTWFLPFLWFRLFLLCSHAHALFQDRFKNVQVGSRWFSTLYILSPNFHIFADWQDWMSISSGLLFVPFVPLRMWSHETSLFFTIYFVLQWFFYVQWIFNVSRIIVSLCMHFDFVQSILCITLPYFAWAAALRAHDLWMRVLLNGSEKLVSSCL